jgi:hypothetical protein
MNVRGFGRDDAVNREDAVALGKAGDSGFARWRQPDHFDSVIRFPAFERFCGAQVKTGKGGQTAREQKQDSRDICKNLTPAVSLCKWSG